MPGTQCYAYGRSHDWTPDGRRREECAAFNARSLRHGNLTAVERRQDDFDCAYQTVRHEQAEREEVERSLYVSHRIE